MTSQASPEEAFIALRHTVGDAVKELKELRQETQELRGDLVRFGHELPIDYSETLEAIATSQKALEKRQAAVQDDLSSATSTKGFIARLSSAADSSFHEPSLELKEIVWNLRSDQPKIWEARKQRRFLWGVGAGSAFGGLLIAFALVWALFVIMPQSVADGAAKALIGEAGAWEAGYQLIRREAPSQADDIVYGQFFYQTNRKTVDACWQRAVKTKKDQKCEIVVPASLAPK